MKKELIGIISGTSPASASTAVGDAVSGLEKFHTIELEADLVGAAGGTLDVYIQRKLGTNLWRDWVHFAQLAAGAAAVKLHARAPLGSVTITTVGGGTDASPGVALAANTNVGCHPGNDIRAVYVAGASTSAGAAVAIRVYGFRG